MAGINRDIDPRTVELLWRYMTHADEQLLSAATTVPDEAYFLERGISWGSLHKLLVHCMDAQRIWLERLKGAVNLPFLDASKISRRELPELWQGRRRELLEFAAAQSAESLAAVLRFKNRKEEPFELTRGACMLHVCDHAAYHRGQINSMIKMAGGQPSPVMLYTWAIDEGWGRVGWE